MKGHCYLVYSHALLFADEAPGPKESEVLKGFGKHSEDGTTRLQSTSDVPKLTLDEL